MNRIVQVRNTWFFKVNSFRLDGIDTTQTTGPTAEPDFNVKQCYVTYSSEAEWRQRQLNLYSMNVTINSGFSFSRYGMMLDEIKIFIEPVSKRTAGY